MNTQLSQSESALDARARRAAKRIGLRAVKSTWRRESCDNHGGYMLVDVWNNSVVDGVRYELTAEQVIDYCTEEPAAS